MTRKEFIGVYNVGYRDGKIEDYCPNDYDDIFDIEQKPKTERIEYGTDGNSYKLTISNGKEFEQESCDDAISRQAVLDATVKRNNIWKYITNSKGENLEEIISQLPPVNPQEPKTGHWDILGCDLYICSKCYAKFTHKFNYCPNCGAKMESEET